MLASDEHGAAVRVWRGITAAGCGLLGILCSMALPALAAEDPVGKADIVAPQVRGTVGELSRDIQVNGDIYADDVIEAAADAGAQITFRDGTKLSIGPASRVTINSYVYDPNTGAGRLAINFVTGIFELVSGALDEAGYDLHIPAGHLSVRGTRLIIDTNRALIAVPSGAVAVDLDNGRSFVLSRSECLIGTEAGRDLMVRAGTGCSGALAGYRAMRDVLSAGLDPKDEIAPLEYDGEQFADQLNLPEVPEEVAPPEEDRPHKPRPDARPPHERRDDLARQLARERAANRQAQAARERADRVERAASRARTAAELLRLHGEEADRVERAAASERAASRAAGDAANRADRATRAESRERAAGQQTGGKGGKGKSGSGR